MAGGISTTIAAGGGGRRRRSSNGGQIIKYRRVVYVDGIKAQSNLTANNTYRWEQLLEELQQQQQQNNGGDENAAAEDRVIPVALFGNAPLAHFLVAMHTGLKFEVRHHDYDSLFPDKQIFWLANVQAIVGYRVQMRFEGMDREGDEMYDFWVNIGSDEVKHVGYSSANTNHCELLPPNQIRTRYQDWSQYMSKMYNCPTFVNTFCKERQLGLIEGRFKVGTRLELLDRQDSSHIRPARVIHQLGRRICVLVCVADVSEEDMGDDEGQIETGIWCDEGWELIFPVGWALQNKWKLVANQAYTEHCQRIVKAIGEGRQPEYTPFDASPAIFNDWKANTEEEENTVHWEVGMKFECIDPLNQSFMEMKVATCIALLNDGYLKVGFDGPDMEDEAIPIHCTSPYLFPINYARDYGIKLVGPTDAENMALFNWDEYLNQCQAIAAPQLLFDPVPPPEKMEQFKLGAKLEATDQCESNLVCPSTLRAVRGRLLQIHFDGWTDDMDQLYDYRSRDLFPLGWCEMYGYKLEPPKTDEPANKRKKNK